VTSASRLASFSRASDLANKVPTGPDWQFEVKHDGWRIIARVDGGRARIWSRHGLDWTKAFPSVAAGWSGSGGT
jgi:bifunctional non-homologous end joining protein LigD